MNDFTGVVAHFYPNGQLAEQRIYNRGKVHGHFNIYYDNGVVVLSGEYDMGRKIGLWKYFRSDGALQTATNYSTTTSWWREV